MKITTTHPHVDLSKIKSRNSLSKLNLDDVYAYELTGHEQTLREWVSSYLSSSPWIHGLPFEDICGEIENGLNKVRP